MPNADTQRALMISSYMADEPVVRTWLALRPQIYAGWDPGEPDPILALIDSHLELWRKAIEMEFGLDYWSAERRAEIHGPLTSPLSNCLKRRRPPLLGCVQLSSTSSRGMTATFSKRVARTSRRFCGHPFFKSRGPPRRLAPRKNRPMARTPTPADVPAFSATDVTRAARALGGGQIGPRRRYRRSLRARAPRGG